MTVKELIETLKTCDENANVVIEQWDGDTFGIGEVNVGFVLQWAKYGLKK